MAEVGIDTSVLIGLLDPKDVWHSQAVALKQALQAYRADIAVFDCVLAEAISTMARILSIFWGQVAHAVWMRQLVDVFTVQNSFPQHRNKFRLPYPPNLLRGYDGSTYLRATASGRFGSSPDTHSD